MWLRLTVQELPCSASLLHVFVHLRHQPRHEVALDFWKSDGDAVRSEFQNRTFAARKSIADLFRWGHKSIRLSSVN